MEKKGKENHSNVLKCYNEKKNIHLVPVIFTFRVVIDKNLRSKTMSLATRTHKLFSWLFGDTSKKET